ncbi:enoyl-CoA hydratase/isomerase family protein [Nocardia sp. NPDC052278]|uniref:enoyl-CoA hydratase/isomerase family protein n=1 Tax=unclassified Nocardia TaxID=2637762 RepID=UPI00368AA5CF
MTDILTDVTDAVCTVTINRPAAHNALNREVLAGLSAAIEEADTTPGIRAVVITASGAKAFSAGADLKELAEMSADEAYEMMRGGQRVMERIARAETPVIAAVNGLALGGGFELALAATFPVLSERASLGLPESRLGLIPGYGGTQRLPRAVGSRVAAYLMLTGSRLDADRAYQLGLTPVHPVAPERLLDSTRELARAIAGKGPAATRSILHAMTVGIDAPIAAGLGVETGLAALAIAGRESTEGIAAFLERRPAMFSDGDEVT